MMEEKSSREIAGDETDRKGETKDKKNENMKEMLVDAVNMHPKEIIRENEGLKVISSQVVVEVVMAQIAKKVKVKVRKSLHH